jgi:hypothetical protein
MREFLSAALGFLLMLFNFMPSASLASVDAVIPAGKRLSLQLNKDLSTKVNSEGDLFTAVVTAPYLLGDWAVIPKGSVVNCSISRIIRPGGFTGRSMMNLLFQSIDIPGRGQFPISATLTSVVPQGNSGVHVEGGMEGRSPVSGDMAKILVPGMIGAVIGRSVGRGNGAVIGAGVGTALGIMAVLVDSGKDIEVHRGSTLVIELNRPLTIPAEGEVAAN